MGDCPICFSAPLTLPLSPHFVSAAYTPPIPFVQISWDIPMNTGALPTLIRYEVVVDGVPETPISRSWLDPQTLQLGITGTASTSVQVTLLSVDLNTRSADNVLATAPQTEQAYP
jgi:hypothetical protein